MTATKNELDTIAAVVSALRSGPLQVRKRLCRGVETMLASQDGRYLEQLDVHLSQLERLADEMSKSA
jgi:hypothetical protein